MKNSFVTLIFVVSLAGCVQMQELDPVTSDGTTSSVTTYTCANYWSMYDTLSDCQTTTLANCTSEWKSFPSGGISLCYEPVSGWEMCSSLTPAADWVYTPYAITCRVGMTMVYHIGRSVLDCSSQICACTSNQEITDTCTDGVDCPTIPSGVPTCP